MEGHMAEDTQAGRENGLQAKDPTSKGLQDTKANKSVDEVSYISTGPRKPSRKNRIVEEDEEPLIDTTEALPLRSKKIERERRKQAKKQLKAAQRPPVTNLLDLPPELLQEILSHLPPSDVFNLLRLNHAMNSFITENETPIARSIIHTRYWVLSRSFPLPIPFTTIDPSARPALLSDRRQEMLQIHKKPYPHVQPIDPHRLCTCMSCVFAWNNLNLLLDLAHWQLNLHNRDPIPMIPRGTTPEWNTRLLATHAATVEKALTSRLTYARILQKHLDTTVATLLRTTTRGKKTIHPRRLYHLTPADAGEETDAFLERSGPPNYEFPWHRDKYYDLEAYVPNRKWSREGERWVYYAEGLHERDLQWVRETFSGAGAGTGTTGMGKAVKGLSLGEALEGFRRQRALAETAKAGEGVDK